jgi:uncharacterized protein (DUF58 family)
MTFVYKPIYWVIRLAEGLWRWARRRFTLTGLIAAGVFLAAGLVGPDIENTVTYQSFSLLLAFLLLGLASCLFFRATFAATRSLPRFGTAGQTLRYRVQIKNLTSKTQTGLTLLEDPADSRPAFPQWLAFQLAENRRVRPFRIAQRRRGNPFRMATVKETEVPPMSARGEAEARVEVLPLRRGILRFTGVTLARPDPLGLFRSFSKIAAPQSVLILPRRYPLPPIALPGAMRYQEGGVALAASVGSSEEFVAIRCGTFTGEAGRRRASRLSRSSRTSFLCGTRWCWTHLTTSRTANFWRRPSRSPPPSPARCSRRSRCSICSSLAISPIASPPAADWRTLIKCWKFSPRWKTARTRILERSNNWCSTTFPP